MRDTHCETRVPRTLVDSLREVSEQDIVANPAWAFAPVAVLSNYERHHINRLPCEAFGKAFDLPVVKWKTQLTGRAAELLNQEDQDGLYEEEPGLWGYFVRGAPAMLTENIQPTKLLVNGACGHMHSLTFSESVSKDVIDDVNRPGYRLLELQEAQFAINFQLEALEDNDKVGIESLVDDAIVVPVLSSKHSKSYNTSSLFACQKVVPKTLLVRGHGITLAFAVTDFKLQGKTKNEMILSVAPRPFPPLLELKGVYMDISRVRKRSGLRVLHRPLQSAGGLDHLYDLQDTAELSIWNMGYDERGNWSRPLARAAAKRRPKQRPGKRRQAYRLSPKQAVTRRSGGDSTAKRKRGVDSSSSESSSEQARRPLPERTAQKPRGGDSSASETSDEELVNCGDTPRQAAKRRRSGDPSISESSDEPLAALPEKKLLHTSERQHDGDSSPSESSE